LSKVQLRADLVDVAGGPPSLSSEDIELQQQHGLADSAEPGEDHAPFVAALLEALDKKSKVL
jgi:hypothetical protein